MQNRDTVVVVFDDRPRAEAALEALRAAGFSAEQTGLVTPDREVARLPVEDAGTGAATGATAGALAGGALGGLSGWLIGIGALAVPGIGPVLAAGPLAAGLTGAAIGAASGGLVGVLTGAGLPESEAQWYDERVRGGGTLVSVAAGDRADEAHAILHRFGGYDYRARS